METTDLVTKQYMVQYAFISSNMDSFETVFTWSLFLKWNVFVWCLYENGSKWKILLSTFQTISDAIFKGAIWNTFSFFPIYMKWKNKKWKNCFLHYNENIMQTTYQNTQFSSNISYDMNFFIVFYYWCNEIYHGKTIFANLKFNTEKIS